MKGGELGCEGHDFVLRRIEQIEHVERCTGADVHDGRVEVEEANVPEELELLEVLRVGGAEHGHAATDDREPLLGSGHEDVVQAFNFAGEKVLEQGLGAIDAEERVKIRTAQILPVVVTPFRFANRRVFWSYCALGIVMRSSSDWERGRDGQWIKAPVQQTRGLNRNFNRVLKAVFKGADTQRSRTSVVCLPPHSTGYNYIPGS